MVKLLFGEFKLGMFCLILDDAVSKIAEMLLLGITVSVGATVSVGVS